MASLLPSSALWAEGDLAQKEGLKGLAERLEVGIRRRSHMVRSEVTIEDLERNVNDAGVQEKLGGQNLLQRCGQKGRAGQCFWNQMVIGYGRDRDQRKGGWF